MRAEGCDQIFGLCYFFGENFESSLVKQPSVVTLLRSEVHPEGHI